MGGGGGGYAVITGPIHLHAQDVHAIGTQFAGSTSTVDSELAVTAVTFGAFWAPVCLPPFASGAISVATLASKIGSELQALSTNIDHCADLYDHGEAKNEALILKAGPKGDSFGDIMTNDAGHGKYDGPDAGLSGDISATVSAFSTLLKSNDIGDGFLALQTGVDVLFDLVGYIDDPLAGILGDLVGTIIDCIPPLKEALDLTLGDPDAISSTSQTWDKLARYFVDCADGYQESMKGIGEDVWSGDAATGYRNRANGAIGLLGDLASRCETISELLLEVGIIIGDVRAFLVGKVSGSIVEQTILFGIALGLAEVPFGASVATFWAEFEIRLEFEEAEVVLAIAQGISDLVLVTGKVVTQGIQFELYKNKLDS